MNAFSHYGRQVRRQSIAGRQTIAGRQAGRQAGGQAGSDSHLFWETNPHRVVRHELQVIQQPKNDRPPNDVHKGPRHHPESFQTPHWYNNIDWLIRWLLLLLLLL